MAIKEINKAFIDRSVKKLDRADIALSEIPNINLYMEQMTDFINENAGGAKRNDKKVIQLKYLVRR